MAVIKFSNGRNVSWLDLNRLRGCDGNIVYDRLYYQEITDDSIGRAINGEETDRDAILIAEIIKSVVKSNRANPIEFDYMRRELVKAGVTNGHHYIRAYRFLGVATAPFELSGYEQATNYLVRECRVRKPQNNVVEYTSRSEIVGLL